VYAPNLDRSSGYLRWLLTLKLKLWSASHFSESLGQVCVQHDAGLAPVVGRLGTIGEWAITTRYPSIVESLTQEQVEAGFETVRELSRQILSRLPEASP
jgi:hypothetical protein